MTINNIVVKSTHEELFTTANTARRLLKTSIFPLNKNIHKDDALPSVAQADM